MDIKITIDDKDAKTLFEEVEKLKRLVDEIDKVVWRIRPFTKFALAEKETADDAGTSSAE